MKHYMLPISLNFQPRKLPDDYNLILGLLFIGGCYLGGLFCGVRGGSLICDGRRIAGFIWTGVSALLIVVGAISNLIAPPWLW